MPWDSVEVGLAGGEETANFGPRKESGSSLYQVDTLASVSPGSGVVSSVVSYCCKFRVFCMRCLKIETCSKYKFKKKNYT